MKVTFSVIIIILGSLICLAQKADDKVSIADRQAVLKKQILVDDFDKQIKDVPIAAVRVFVRIKLAEWLWKDGKDETARAEPIAVKAFEELYDKGNEIGETIYLKASLFHLLETNASETAQRLKAKYKIESKEDLMATPLSTNKKGDDKILAEKIRRNLPTTNNLSTIEVFLINLQQQKSPELPSVLAEILNLQETGRIDYPPQSLSLIRNNFNDSIVPNDLRIRFYKIVINKARNALKTSNSGEIHFADLLLFGTLPDIAANAPDLLEEANTIKSALSAKTTQGDREHQETEKRIAASADKLEALISEAEKTDIQGKKFLLLSRASRLAQKEEKFRLATDLIEKTFEDKSENNPASREIRLSLHDQQLGFIVESSLVNNDIDSAVYASKKIVGELKKADALRQIAGYLHRNKDTVVALNNYNEALKLAVKADNDKTSIRTLFGLTLAARMIDPSRVSELTLITSKAINNLPTLNAEDKPGTENYKNYVSTIISVDSFLYPMMKAFASRNRNEAADLANKINRKEIAIAADLALIVDAADSKNKVMSK